MIEFYTRRGDFPAANLPNLAPDIIEILTLQGLPARHDAVVTFLLTLTDERVRQEAAPFDHPQLFLPNGAPAGQPGQEIMEELPAVGRSGRAAQGLPPLGTFLGVSPFDVPPPLTPTATAGPHGSSGRPPRPVATSCG